MLELEGIFYLTGTCLFYPLSPLECTLVLITLPFFNDVFARQILIVAYMSWSVVTFMSLRLCGLRTFRWMLFSICLSGLVEG